jgi:hypothetical protein
MTVEQQQDGAVEEVRTFLDALPPRIDIVADWTRNGVRNELTAEALRAVLAERVALAGRVAELEGEREADARAVEADSGRAATEAFERLWTLWFATCDPQLVMGPQEVADVETVLVEIKRLWDAKSGNAAAVAPRQEWGFRLRESPEVIDPGYVTEDHARLCASRAAGSGIVTRFHSGRIVSEWQDVPDAAETEES